MNAATIGEKRKNTTYGWPFFAGIGLGLFIALMFITYILERVGPIDEAIAVTAMIYLAAAIGGVVALSQLLVGNRQLSEEDLEDLADHKALVGLHAAMRACIGGALTLLAVRTLVGWDAATMLAAIGLPVMGAAILARMHWRRSDELQRALTRDGLAVLALLVAVILGSWVVLAEFDTAPALESMVVIPVIAGGHLVSRFAVHFVRRVSPAGHTRNF